MIQPLNNHVLIEPIVHDSFIASTKETYEEIGTVLAIAESVEITYGSNLSPIKNGDKVYFDSWLAAKYPTEEPDKHYWLVPFENIRAYERKIPE